MSVTAGGSHGDRGIDLAGVSGGKGWSKRCAHLRWDPWRAAFGLWAMLCLGPGTALAATSLRVEVPIRQVVLSNHDIRYSVPVSVGGSRPVDATLDTGSFGLRILNAALAPSEYASTGIERAYPYGSGVRLRGVIARGRIDIGGAATANAVPFQLVQSVDCIEQKPDCPAARVDPADYRIAGDGLPGEGFEAILGISMRSAGTAIAANNPLSQMGTGRWIVVLPRPGDTEAGRLIINPDADELQGFRQFQLAPQNDPRRDPNAEPGWLDGKLPGCLVAEGSATRFCAATSIDSGAVGIVAESSSVTTRTPWRAGTHASIILSEGDAQVASDFVVGETLASRVTLVPVRGDAGQKLNAGVVAYYFYAVAYDSQAGTIGFKPRTDAPPP